MLFFDEIDALQGRTLISVLSQLRSGSRNRPVTFPGSVALCGLRDLRDYKAASGGDPTRLGGASPFNIAVESLRLGDFTLDEIRSLYGQHTAGTGQVFAPGAVEQVFALTAGQPWLVNAIANEIVRRMAEAVIGLAPNLFYGTGLAACVLVLRRAKPEAARRQVLVVNGENRRARGRRGPPGGRW
ncbi:N-6 DNA methylase [Pseudofrankia sp. DC12]|uniref:N-6 DNA methylase n=1 Tax=Pseudofrankia sp. DC12 TaxID=683315 RepID=UPI000A956A2B|nr:N-6 DNA methylase [Pseudofrankia sp. DC12]